MAKTTKKSKKTTRRTKLDPEMQAVLDLVMQLMAIPGKSCEEALVAKFVTQKLRKAGAPADAIKHDLAHRRTPSPGEVGNLMLKLPGRGSAEMRRAPRRLLMAHLDTVPICVGSQPVLKGDRVYSANPESGLGADDRAGVAVILHTAIEMLRRKEHPPITFLWSVQEEIGLHGVRHASLGPLGKPKLSFNFDGGSPEKMTCGATGGYRMTISIEGLASHAGGAPEQGVSAIAIASLAIADLHNNGWHGAITKGRRSGTSNVGVIEGGAGTNVVADRVTMKAEARSHDPVFRKKILSEIEKAFRRAAKSVKNVQGKSGKVSFEGQLDYESFRLADDEPCLLAAERAVRSCGGSPMRAVTNGGLDANWMSQRGIPTVTMGCGQLNQHTIDEQLSVPDYLLACRVARLLAEQAEL